MKKITCCLLAIVLVFSLMFSGCSKEEDKSVSSITPAMWKVEDTNGNVNYLFGTIHAADDSAAVLPDYFENAYKDCEAIAVEIDISDPTELLSQSGDTLSYLMYTDGTTIRDHISAETYKGVNEVMKNNYNMYVEGLYDTFTPMAWSSILEGAVIEKCGMDTNKGIDITLTKRAKGDNKSVYEVESMESQMKVFEDLSDNVGELLLSPYTTQEGFDVQVVQMKLTYADWKNGNPMSDDIDESELEGLDAETREALEYYQETMLGNRNPLMADKIQEYMKQGKKVLVMVGAAHFYGKDGIVNLLRERGYTVTRISPAAQKNEDVIGAK